MWVWNGSSWYANVSIDWSVPIEAGDILYVHQVGETPFSLTVPEIKVHVDRGTDTISGQISSNITNADPFTLPNLFIKAAGANHDSATWEELSKYLTTGADGSFSAVFTYTLPTAGTLDLQANTTGYIRYANQQGNIFTFGFHAPFVSVQENGFVVNGYVNPNETVTVTLASAGGVTKGQFTAVADNLGWFYDTLYDVHGNVVNSSPGDTVTVQTDEQIIVPVPLLTASADPAANTVAGEAPPGITSTSSLTLPYLGAVNDN